MIIPNSIALAGHDDVRTIAVMSRDTIEYGLPWRYTPARVARLLKEPEVNLVVARDAGDLVGFGAMRYAVEEAHLHLLAVAPLRRRSGVGAALLAWLERSALTAGIGIVSLEARTDNRAARAFYASLGYQEVAYMRGYYLGREDGVRLAKDLWSDARV
jgi:[ribosomal protein S18]-alanine N-acetyltransferase